MYPEIFFLAAGELLSFMIFTSAVITYIVQPLSMQCWDNGVQVCNNSTLELNAIKLRVGHNNPCVYFDTPPAKYFAAVVFVFAAYCGIRYCILDMERTLRIQAEENSRLGGCMVCFSIFSDVIYALAWAGFVLTYVIPPWQDVWGHSTGFICLGTAQFFIFFSNVLEGENFPICVYIFCAIYGIFTIAEFGFAAALNFYWYETYGQPFVPDLLGIFIDYGWFGMLAATSAVMPRGEALVRTTKVEPGPFNIGYIPDEEDYGESDDEEEPLHDEEES
jgi:hypothetical protein